MPERSEAQSRNTHALVVEPTTLGWRRLWRYAWDGDLFKVFRSGHQEVTFRLRWLERGAILQAALSAVELNDPEHVVGREGGTIWRGLKVSVVPRQHDGEMRWRSLLFECGPGVSLRHEAARRGAA